MVWLGDYANNKQIHFNIDFVGHKNTLQVYFRWAHTLSALKEIC